MSGTSKGGKLASKKISERLDPIYLEKYGMTFRQYIGSQGGKVKNPKKGFGSDRKAASRAGAIGGTVSRRYK